MVFERLLRLTKKCPGYVVSGLRNASVGIATVTQESFESQYYVTRALFGARSLFAITAPSPSSEGNSIPSLVLEYSVGRCHCTVLGMYLRDWPSMSDRIALFSGFAS